MSSGSRCSQTTTNATSETMKVTIDSASCTSLSRAMSTPASTVQTPIRMRTGMKSCSGSSRYWPRRSSRPPRSAISRSDSRISALNAAWIDSQEHRRATEQKQSERRHAGRATPFNQPLDEPALEAQAAFQASHPAVIALVIIAKKVQQAMQGQHPQLDRERMAGLPRLTARNSCRNHDIAQFARLAGGKRQDVGRRVLAAISVVERTHARVRNHGHGHRTARPGRRDAPASQRASPGARTPRSRRSTQRRT